MRGFTQKSHLKPRTSVTNNYREKNFKTSNQSTVTCQLYTILRQNSSIWFKSLAQIWRRWCDTRILQLNTNPIIEILNTIFLQTVWKLLKMGNGSQGLWKFYLIVCALCSELVDYKHAATPKSPKRQRLMVMESWSRCRKKNQEKIKKV